MRPADIDEYLESEATQEFAPEPGKRIPATFYLIVGRLLFFGAMSITTSAIGLLNGEVNLAGVVGGYSVYAGLKLLRLSPHCRDSTINCYQWLYFLDILLSALLVCMFFLATTLTLTTTSLQWTSSLPTWLQIAIALLWLAVLVPGDLLFCKWALRTLQSQEYRDGLSNCHWSSHRKNVAWSLPMLFVWTAVAAAIGGTFAEQLRSGEFHSVATYRFSSSVTDSNLQKQLSMELERFQRENAFGSGEHTIYVVSADVAESELDSNTMIDDPAPEFSLSVGNPDSHPVPGVHKQHNLVFKSNGATESTLMEFEENELRRYLTECEINFEIPTLDGFTDYLLEL